MQLYHDFFFGTRIQINVSWYGSGSGSWPMIRIRIRNTDNYYMIYILFIFNFRVKMVEDELREMLLDYKNMAESGNKQNTKLVFL